VEHFPPLPPHPTRPAPPQIETRGTVKAPVPLPAAAPPPLRPLQSPMGAPEILPTIGFDRALPASSLLHRIPTARTQSRASASQQLATAMQPGLQCALGHAQNPCGLSQILFFKVVHEDRLPIALRKRQHGATHSLGALVLLQIVKHAFFHREH